MSTVETQTVRAQAKWVRTSARKARIVAEHIRGRSVPEARAVLAFTQRAAARDLEKVLSSAVANAESRPDLHWNGDDLVVVTAYADEGRTLKRFRPRARGRASAILKRTCHITVELAMTPAAIAAAQAAAAAAPRRQRAPRKTEETAPVVEGGTTEAAEAAEPAEQPPAEETES